MFFKIKEKTKEEDIKNKPVGFRWPWPDPLDEYGQQRMNDNLRLLAKDAFFVSLALFLIFSWFEWRNPGISSGIFHPGILFILFLFFLSIYQMDWLKKKIFDRKFILGIFSAFTFYQILLFTTNFLAKTHPILSSQILKNETFVTIFFSFIFLILANSHKTENPVKKIKDKKFYLISLSVITVWSAFLIFYKLDKNDLFHDEQWHVSVIESLRHGEGMKLWDFTTDQPTKTYTRGIEVNYAGYFFSKIFGYSEFSLRFFPALIGTLLIPLIYFTFKDFIGKAAALITAMGFSFNLSALFLARFLRPYPSSLLFYVLAIYFYKKFLDKLIENKDNKKILLFLFLSGLNFSLSIQGSGLSKILLAIIPLHFAIFCFGNRQMLLTKYKENKKMVYWGLGILAISLSFLEIAGVTNLTYLFKEIRHHLKFEKASTPAIIYWQYVLAKYIKDYFLFKFFFIFGLLSLSWNDLKSRKKLKILFALNGVLPLIFLTFFLERYEDFRYIYLAIPFIYGIGIYGLIKFIKLAFSSLKMNCFAPSLAILISVVLIFYPVLPIQEIAGFNKKSPALWNDDYEQKEIHRRAVAPEFKKVYDYLNKNQKEGDAVIITDAQYYLEKKKGVNYYRPKDWQDGSIVIDTRSGKELSIFDLTNQGNVYFLNNYSHLLDGDVRNYFSEKCENLSEKLGVKKYYYVDWYKDKNLYWPNLFYCKKL